MPSKRSEFYVLCFCLICFKPAAVFRKLILKEKEPESHGIQWLLFHKMQPREGANNSRTRVSLHAHLVKAKNKNK